MPQYKEDSLVLKVLKTLKEGARTIDDVANDLHIFMAESGFGSGYKGQQTKEEYIIYKKKIIRDKQEEFNKERRRQDRKKLQNLLCKLKREGLTQKTKIIGKLSRFSITRKGTDKVENLIKKIKLLQLNNSWLSRVSDNYKVKPIKSLTVIFFDIPETEKKKRDWLRSTIKNLGFKKLQKSVWIGKIELPEIFIHDLKKINILQYVIICSVAKEGNILDHI